MDRNDFPRPAPEIIEDGVPATDEIPEEQAMRIETDPPGLTDDEGPGYLDGE